MALYEQFQNVPAQSLQAAGNFGVDISNARNIDARTAQQQAETQDYLLQSRREMRDAMVKAETAKANADIQMSKFVTDNPVLYNQIMTSGAHQKISEAQSKASDDDINTQGNIMKDITPDDYLDKYTELSRQAPQLASAWPTPEEVARDPNKLAKAKYMAGVVSMNRTERTAAATAKATADAALLREREGNATQLKVTGMTTANQRLMNDADNAAAAETARLNRENTKEIAGMNIAGRESVATIKAAADEKRAVIRAKAGATGKPPKFYEYGKELDQFGEGSLVVDNIIDNLDIDPPGGDRQAFKAQMWAAAKSEWATQSQLYQEGRLATIPASPQDIYIEMARSALVSPDAYKKGLALINTGEINTDRPKTTVPAKSSVTPEEVDIRDIGVPKSSITKLGPEAFKDAATYERYRKATPDQRKQVEQILERERNEFLDQMRNKK